MLKENGANAGNGSLNPGGRFEIPWDLTDWVPPELLQQWVQAEVSTLDWDRSELVEFLRLRTDYRPKQLLCILTYAYSAGMFEAEEIINQVRCPGPILALSEDYNPTRQDIQRFRRENRGLVRWSLVQLLKRVLREKFRLEGVLFPAGLNSYLVQTATERLNLARHLYRQGQWE